MAKIEIYDPPMCCSTGVCGPNPDPKLVRFAADLDWLRGQGIEVRRFNLAQEPTAFTQNAEVKRLLAETDGDGLPLIMVNGRVVVHGEYPGREQLGQWVGVAGNGQPEEAIAPPAEQQTLITPAVTELIAIGAAIASNCEPCFKYHYNQAKNLGVSNDDMLEAVNTSLQVKDAPAQAMVQLAQKTLLPEATSAGGCCGGGSSCC